MKFILYGVGGHIKTGDYTNKIAEDVKILRNTLLYALDYADVRYFFEEKAAREYAVQKAQYIAPAKTKCLIKQQGVYKLEMQLLSAEKFIVSRIITADVAGFPPVDLNFEFTNYPKVFHHALICHQGNFDGDFRKIKPYLENKKRCLLFLYGNKNGFEYQSKNYKIPTGLDREICEYVMGRYLRKNKT